MAIQLAFDLSVIAPDEHRAISGKRERSCLSCSSKFPSFGAGNRICSDCKEREIWKSQIADFPVHSPNSIAF